MSARPSFADWQFARGIVPWVVVHDFSEAYYLRWQMDMRCRAALRRTAEPLVEAFRGMASAVAALVETFTRATSSPVGAAHAGAHDVRGEQVGQDFSGSRGVAET